LHVLRLILFVVPLSLDTFAVAAALGVAGLPPRRRLRVSLVLSGFEAGMPLVGLLAGRALGSAVGGVAGYLAVGLLAGLGLYLLLLGEDEPQGVPTGAVALVALGLGISLDELALGFAIGLLGLPLVPALVLIGAQGFLAAQLGLRVGGRLGEAARERVEQVAALALLAVAALLLALQLA
jgi:putative Mn2+ efflux pump MntP